MEQKTDLSLVTAFPQAGRRVTGEASESSEYLTRRAENRDRILHTVTPAYFTMSAASACAQPPTPVLAANALNQNTVSQSHKITSMDNK